MTGKLFNYQYMVGRLPMYITAREKGQEYTSLYLEKRLQESTTGRETTKVKNKTLKSARIRISITYRRKCDRICKSMTRR